MLLGADSAAQPGRLVLTPVDGAMDEVVITDGVFAVGRREPAFGVHDEERLGRLSRRHARVFVHEGRAYVADLGSLNGTFANEQRVGETPLELHSGDTLSFAHTFDFSVSLDTAMLDRTVPYTPEASVTLVPEMAGLELDTLVISRFPFLVSRDQPPFAHLPRTDAINGKNLSKRHAVINSAGGVVTVEDLDSTNGTFVNGNALDELAHTLRNGDVLKFGAEPFRYRVQLAASGDETVLASDGTELVSDATEIAQPEAPQPSPAPANPDITQPQRPPDPTDAPQPAAVSTQPEDRSPNTFLVSEGTSFLDVFLAVPDEEEEPADEPVVVNPPPAKGSRVRATLRAFGNALDIGSSGSRPWITVGLGLLVVVAALAGYRYFSQQDYREALAAFEQGDYLTSARISHNALVTGDTQPDLVRLAQESLVRGLADEWTRQLDTQSFDDAEALLANLREKFGGFTRSRELLQFLSWATAVTVSAADESADDTQTSLFQDFSGVRNLVNQWDQNEVLYQKSTSQLSAYDPRLEQRMARVMSDFRLLRERTLDDADIMQLKETVLRLLADGEVRRAQLSISDFSDKRPEVQGANGLSKDLGTVARLRLAFRAGEVGTLAAFDAQRDLITPWIRDSVGEWGARILPDPETLALQQRAMAAWQAGASQEAIALLNEVQSEPWADYSNMQAERYRNVNAAFTALGDQPEDSTAYAQGAADLWLRLKDEDTYYRAALSPVVTQFRSGVGGTLQQTYAKAKAVWAEYLDNGRIRALMRIEDPVSNLYRRQATRLTEAYGAAVEAQRLAEITQDQMLPQVQRFSRTVTDELRRQRRWLGDLGGVLDGDLLASKLELLPALQEESE